MGVTIHFEGRLRNQETCSPCIKAILAVAEKHSWPHVLIDESDQELTRFQNDESWTYSGPTKGIRVQPHPNSEPFRFEVGQDLIFQNYCKTQFAPLEIHMQVVELLRLLSKRAESCSVVDEGEYYETSDAERLEELRTECFEALETHLAENPKCRGPVRLGNGRIADIVS